MMFYIIIRIGDNMRYLNLDKVMIGSKLGKSIIYNENQVLLREGAILTDGLISRLKEKNISYVYVDDELSKEVQIEENIPLTLKNSISVALSKVNIDDTIENAKKMADKIYDSNNISVENYDSNTKEEYDHSIFVAELSVVLGKALNYRQDRLNELAAAALLHDIGKSCVDEKSMEEYGVNNLLKRLGLNCTIDKYRDSIHSFLGYSILNKNVAVSAMMKQAVLFHHENVDGSGDLKITGDRICEFAKIIHIANDFSRMITDAEKYNIHNTSEVIEYFKSNSGTKYDTNLVNVFFYQISLYPPGITVELSNGMSAIVAQNNTAFPSRPIVILENGMKIDLSNIKYQSLTIIGVDLNIKKVINKQL